MMPVPWLTNRSRTRCKCLQIELRGRLCRHKLHGWALHRLSDRLGIAEIVLLPFE
jgi:hypothetical protein